MKWIIGLGAIAAGVWAGYRIYEAEENAVPWLRALSHPFVPVVALRLPGGLLGTKQKLELLRHPEARRGTAHFNG